MIECYCAATPNARRVTIMLELCELAHKKIQLDLSSGAQRAPDFLAISPGGTVPAIVDHDGPAGGKIAIAQSTAICIYLAEKTGRFLPANAARRLETLQWFQHVATDVTMAIATLFRLQMASEDGTATAALMRERLERHLGVIDTRLANRQFIMDELTIADVALYPFLVGGHIEPALHSLGLSSLLQWRNRFEALPAVTRG